MASRGHVGVEVLSRLFPRGLFPAPELCPSSHSGPSSKCTVRTAEICLQLSAELGMDRAGEPGLTVLPPGLKEAGSGADTTGGCHCFEDSKLLMPLAFGQFWAAAECVSQECSGRGGAAHTWGSSLHHPLCSPVAVAQGAGPGGVQL